MDSPVIGGGGGNGESGECRSGAHISTGAQACTEQVAQCSMVYEQAAAAVSRGVSAEVPGSAVVTTSA